MERAGHPLAPQLDDHVGQVGGEGGVADLVVDETEGAAPLPQPQQGLHHVVAVLAAHPRGADDRPGGIDLQLAAQLGTAVDRLGIGAIPLQVRPGLGPIEDVVGGDIHQVRPQPAGAVGDEPGGQCVGPPGGLGLFLAQVHGRERRAVEDDVGLELRDDAEGRVTVGQVELGQINRHHLVAFWKPGGDVGAELPPGAGEQNAHQTILARPRHPLRYPLFIPAVGGPLTSSTR